MVAIAGALLWAEQAIFTSIPRQGRAGYHLVSRSAGITEPEATALATWAPSHGALLIDGANHTSVNFHTLPSGRFALSRTCQGPAEYSGRGERQLYTHALVFDADALAAVEHHPIAIYRDALSLGYLNFQAEPEAMLKSIALGHVHQAIDPGECARRARGLGLETVELLQTHLASGQRLQLQFAGDRIALVECLLGLLPPEIVAETTFSTSLQPSAVRPYRLVLVN